MPASIELYAPLGPTTQVRQVQMGPVTLYFAGPHVIAYRLRQGGGWRCRNWHQSPAYSRHLRRLGLIGLPEAQHSQEAFAEEALRVVRAALTGDGPPGVVLGRRRRVLILDQEERFCPRASSS